MLSYLARRLLLGGLTLWGVATVVFALVRLLPGDPAQVMLARSGASAQAIAALRVQLGLDRPLPEQYGLWLRQMAAGDLGQSLTSGRPVAQVIAEQFPYTASLALAALLWMLGLGLPLGLAAAHWAHRWPDRLAMALAVGGASVPVFWSGLLLIWVFSVGLRWLPATGARGWQSLVMPSLVLGFASAGPLARLARVTLLEILGQPYVTAARARGMAERQVLLRHALRNAVVPLTTLIGLQLSFLLAGTVITETVFSRPGLGQLLVNAILWRDLPVVQGVVLVIAGIYVMINVLTDLVAGWLDPQIGWR